MSDRRLLLSIILGMVTLTCSAETWKRHTIDDSLIGADGVRLADFDRDGLPDTVTGWEESGIVRLYLNPGPERSTATWPVVTVGKGRSPEDAVAFDVDGDGDLDVVSCHEGKLRQVLVHRFDGDCKNRKSLLDEANWVTKPFSQVDGVAWMFAAPIQLRDGSDCIAIGGKGKGATLTLLAPAGGTSRSELAAWSTNRLRDLGWVMSIYIRDMDSDGDQDIVFSDRKGMSRGVYWMEQPNENAATEPWPEHLVGGKEYEVMFVQALPGRIYASTRNACWIDFHQKDGVWTSTLRDNPPNIPHGKAIHELPSRGFVMTANTSSDKLTSARPALWFRSSGDDSWMPIGTATRAKFDRMELIDLDGDGDLDVMTCEERRRLGVVWYENPSIN